MKDSVTEYDFDKPLDRRKGDSLKWNRYAGRDVLPLWVADMDFAAPPAVLATLRGRIDQGCLGYPVPTPSLVEAVVAYLQREYGWAVQPEWLVWLPGIVTGLNVACRAVDGDVITATPVYPPFLSAPVLSGKKLAAVPLRLSEQRWGWDFAAMEAAITPETGLLLLCHPHNPVGRVWSPDELAELSAFCKRHDLIVCSDEIHCGLILEEGCRHTPMALVDPEIGKRSITLMAPSKSHNIPGLCCSFGVIPDAALRRSFTGAMRGIVAEVNVLGLAAAESAYRDCEGWQKALIKVLQRNRDLVQAAVAQMPGLSMTPVEATYLAWIDARGLGVANPAQFFEEAGVGLSNGADFGLPGWVRLNFGCSRATLEAALERMQAACLARSAAMAVDH